MEPPVQPPPPTPAGKPLSIWQFAAVILANAVVAQLTEHRWGDRRLLWLPLLNLLAGCLLQATRYDRLGRVLLLGTLVVGLIGLGTCVLLMS